MTEGQSFFEKVVAECGLSYVFATKTIRRACERAAIRPEALTPEDLELVVPYIQQSLEVFLTPEEAENRVGRIILMTSCEPPPSRPPLSKPPPSRRPKQDPPPPSVRRQPGYVDS